MVFRYVVVPCAALMLVLPASLAAQNAARSQLPALKQMSLEELMNVDVSLPLRRPEAVRNAAAAVSVLTNEDIRRSGAVSLPDALQFVPGLYAARFTTSSWVVTARGFASTAANKMLVMIDGRSIYSPLFSGVFWEVQDAVLADVDRIEVVRGPGASLWGSNAVNGVISVVSKRASATQGTLVSIGTGSEAHLFASARHGGRVGSGHYRVYGKGFTRDDAHLADSAPAQDGQQLGLAGFVVEMGDPDNGWTIRGDLVQSRAHLADRDDLESSGASLVGRWNHKVSAASDLQLQVYYDRTTRMVPLQITETRHTVDFDLQQRVKVRRRHTVAWGAGYRLSADDTVPTPLIVFEPEDRANSLVSAFLQDEIALSPALTATLGTKVEHNDYTGMELQPTGRLSWEPTASHTAWGAVSRAVRLPTRLDTDVRILAGTRVAIAGNPDFESENVLAYEAGYRTTPLSSVTVDVAVFHNQYDDLRTQEFPAAAGQPIVVGNALQAASSGVELTVRYQPRPWLTGTGSYAYLTTALTLDPGSRDLTGGATEAIDPHHQLLMQGRVDLPRGVELDVTVRRISDLPVPGEQTYTEGSFRLGWRVTSWLEASLVGRNLFHADHVEFASPTSSRQTRLERALFTHVTVAF